MIKRSDGRWQENVTVAPKVKKTFYSNEKTKEKASADIKRQIVQYHYEQKQEKHNFLALANQMLAEKETTVSHSTYANYSFALKHLKEFYDYNIEDITPSAFQSFLNKKARENMSQSYLSKIKITFGLVLNYAILNDLPLNNFMPSIKLPKIVRKSKVSAATDKECSVIIKSAENVKFGMWAMVLLCTGMRQGELAALQRKDIDFDRDNIHVWRSVEFINSAPHLKDMPKSVSGIRNVPILSLLKPLLFEMCKDMKPNDFIFNGDSPITKTMITKRWKRYCDEVGINIHQHQLRHSYAKILYRSGVDAKTAQGLLGHSDIQTTMNIYTEFAEDVTLKSTQKVDAFLNTLL